MWALLGSQGANSDSVSIKWSDTDTTCHVQAFSNDLMLTIMRIGNSYWILVFFAICLLLQNAGFFASDPPSPSPEWAVQLFMWEALYIEICYAYSGGAGGVPAQKFGLFETAGGQTVASFGDRLLIHIQPASAHTPQKQKKSKKQQKGMFRLRLQPIPCTIVIFGMSHGQRSTLVAWSLQHQLRFLGKKMM